jgi:hypothetical protein
MFGLNEEAEQSSAACDLEAGFCSACAE